MDDIDIAGEVADRFTSKALAAHVGRERPTGPSSPVCVECGDAIPPARMRMAAGCKLCVSCQSDYEKASG